MSVAPNPIDINYLTRVGYLWRNGELYHYDGTLSPPGCWVPGVSMGSRTLRSALSVTGASSATRFLPPYYSPPAGISVVITAAPDAAVSAYAIQDTPPTGWQVSTINNSGGWDSINHIVKWGPFFDNTQRVLSYQATPPSNQTGLVTFSGIFSVDGTGLAIGGATAINPTPYLAWKSSCFTTAELADATISGDNADPAHDGIPNLLKYALGLDAKVASPTDLPFPGMQPGYLTLTYRQNKQATDILYFVEACSDLTGAAWSTNDVVEISRINSNTYWSVTARDSVTVTEATNRFLHLRIKRP
jgi:hypothetical protein